MDDVGRRLVGGAFDRQFGRYVVGRCAKGRRHDILQQPDTRVIIYR